MIEKLQFYDKLLLFCFGIFITGITTLMLSTASQAQLVDPPCKTSTCISGEMIGVAKGALVEFDKMNAFADLLAADVACAAPRPTNVIVQRQVPGAIEPFPDSFCTNQGCVPVNDGAECAK